MEKKLLLSVVVMLMVVLTASPILALSPMGTPTASLKQGQFHVGVDYAYSEMDLEATLSDDAVDLADWLGLDGLDKSQTIKNVKFNTVAANIGYGLLDNWEAFIRLGGANAEVDELSGDFGFLGGLGTRVTLIEQGDLSWGAMAQINWFKSDFTGTIEDVDYDFEVEAYETQIAVGPTWKVSDAFSFYGGPFLHLFDGNVESGGTTWADLEQKSEFGGYVGTQIDLTQHAFGYLLFCEFQFTGDAWGIGTGIGWKF